MGSLAGRDLTVVAQVAPFLIVGSLLALFLGRVAEHALARRGRGSRPRRQRRPRPGDLGRGAWCCSCGAATAACGPIAFVGLTIPHVARMIVGPDYRWALPYSMVLAPILLLAADIVGRVIARPGEVQVGIVTGIDRRARCSSPWSAAGSWRSCDRRPVPVDSVAAPPRASDAADVRRVAPATGVRLLVDDRSARSC